MLETCIRGPGQSSMVGVLKQIICILYHFIKFGICIREPGLSSMVGSFLNAPVLLNRWIQIPSMIYFIEEIFIVCKYVVGKHKFGSYFIAISSQQADIDQRVGATSKICWESATQKNIFWKTLKWSQHRPRPTNLPKIYLSFQFCKTSNLLTTHPPTSASRQPAWGPPSSSPPSRPSPPTPSRSPCWCFVLLPTQPLPSKVHSYSVQCNFDGWWLLW